MRCLIALLLVFSFVSMVSAQDHEITLTTYYPAPYGEYQRLAVGSAPSMPNSSGVINFEPIADPAVGTTVEGDLYYSAADDQFKYCDTDGAVGVPFGGGSGAILDVVTGVGPGTKAAPSMHVAGANNVEAAVTLSTGTWIIFVSFEALPLDENNSGSPTGEEEYFFRWGLRAGLTEILGDTTTVNFNSPTTVLWENYSAGSGGHCYAAYSASTVHTVSPASEIINLTFTPTITIPAPSVTYRVYVRRASIIAMRIA